MNPETNRCDVAVYAPGLGAGGGAESTALKAATACARMGLNVTFLTDAPIDASWVESHFAVDIERLEFVVLPQPRQVPLPDALQLLLRDRRHLRAVQALRPRVFINMKFRSELPGCGEASWYYVHFPHLLTIEARSFLHRRYLGAIIALRRFVLHPRRPNFVSTYDFVSANSAFTQGQVAARWSIVSEALHPPCGSVRSNITPSSRRQRMIVSVGRFQASGGPSVPYKAQDVLIAAFGELIRADPEGDWHLHMVGSLSQARSDSDFLKSLEHLARDLPVTFHVDASKDDLAGLYDRAFLYWHAQGVGTDAAAYPQAQEHFGISTVEAMAAGAIPLVYGTAGPQEVVMPVLPELAWSNSAELVRRTMAMRMRSQDELQRRCLERAKDFTDAHFENAVQQRVSALLFTASTGADTA